MFRRGGSKERGGGGGGGGARPLTAGASVFGPDEGEPTYPCKVCGRKFVKASLGRHQDACKRLAKPSRKPFESGAQRAGEGSDIGMRDVLKVKKEIEKGRFERPKTNWRERHEEFQNAVHAAKGVDTALKTGGPLPPPVPSKVPSDYIKCDFCGRNFNQQAADRHIPHCERQFNEKQLNNKHKPPSGRNGGSGRPRTNRGDPSPSGRPRSRRNSAEPGSRDRGGPMKAPPTRDDRDRRRGSAGGDRDKDRDRDRGSRDRKAESARSDRGSGSRHGSRERRR